MSSKKRYYTCMSGVGKFENRIIDKYPPNYVKEINDGNKEIMKKFPEFTPLILHWWKEIDEDLIEEDENV